ncbi:hypothetical protein VFPPC_16783 [Pochonia chlamydosporia 170]|uniref:Uncharacterized protein n=1 Tax=Pochonia chlamydosporia 170 TaxID=1380566 RepID=A0A179F4Y1_METCM|nr:hypothetical protein VFPPC_16783 [Pochonia chlamydosporia 170]OAQ60233.1 hypothetical protein VFPPC_16783 [Pochonia chlamydosporia 170]
MICQSSLTAMLSRQAWGCVWLLLLSHGAHANLLVKSTCWKLSRRRRTCALTSHCAYK